MHKLPSVPVLSEFIQLWFLRAALFVIVHYQKILQMVSLCHHYYNNMHQHLKKSLSLQSYKITVILKLSLANLFVWHLKQSVELHCVIKTTTTTTATQSAL